MIKIDLDFILNTLKKKRGKAKLEDFLIDFPLPENILTSDDERSTALAIIKQLIISLKNEYVGIEISAGQEPIFVILKDLG